MSEIRQSLDEDLFPEFIKEFHKNRALGVLETTG
jgi:queuine tRNA-ribosyltransferase